MQAAPIKSAVSRSETDLYHELGLGRGVNVTDPEMWKNKSSFLVRKVHPDLKNIIGTQECGILEHYKKNVPTFAMHLQKMQRVQSLNNPYSQQVKIGMDEHYSQASTGSMKMIEGHRIETRTISFRFDFSDILLSNEACIEVPAQDFLSDTDDSFKEGLSTWILKRIHDRRKQPEEVTSVRNVLDGDRVATSGDEHETFIPGLARTLHDLTEQEGLDKSVVQDCKDFVKYFGITHYVSAIKLGACQYRVDTHSKQTKLRVGADVGAASVAKSSFSAKLWFRKTEEQKIGRISENDTVERENEAVIEFQIQPIHKLVRVQFIQKALQEAINVYIQSKVNKQEGPFLISCQVNQNRVYWTVNSDYQVLGTESVDEAESFYISTTGDPTHPSEFFIAFWGNEGSTREIEMQGKDEERLPLLRYLSTESNVFGYCSGPLTLKTTVEIQQARFSLCNRVQHSIACLMCQSTPVSLGDWIQGEQFYINCNHSSFKIDTYVAMKPLDSQSRQADTVQSMYKTITAPTMKDPSKSTDYGMLFRLHPLELKGNSPDSTTQPLPEPPANQGDKPQSDEIVQESTMIIQEPIVTDAQELTEMMVQETTRVQEPTVTKAKEPTVAKVQEPMMTKVQELMVMKVQEPMVWKVTLTEVQEPTMTKVQEPVITKVQGLEPKMTKVQEPVTTKVQEPTLTKVQEPTMKKVQEPTMIKAQEPTMTKPMVTKSHKSTMTKIQEPAFTKILLEDLPSWSSKVPLHPIIPSRRTTAGIRWPPLSTTVRRPLFHVTETKYIPTDLPKSNSSSPPLSLSSSDSKSPVQERAINSDLYIGQSQMPVLFGFNV